MIATSDGKTVNIGRDFVDSVTMRDGYNVALHGLPGFAFRVSLAVADSVDKAQALAVATVRRERPLASTAATVQRFGAL